MKEVFLLRTSFPGFCYPNSIGFFCPVSPPSTVVMRALFLASPPPIGGVG